MASAPLLMTRPSVFLKKYYEWKCPNRKNKHNDRKQKAKPCKFFSFLCKVPAIIKTKLLCQFSPLDFITYGVPFTEEDEDARGCSGCKKERKIKRFS